MDKQPTTEFPLPEVGQVRFHFLTFEGAHSVVASEEELRQHQNILYPLFYAGQDVITQIRLLNEKDR